MLYTNMLLNDYFGEKILKKYKITKMIIMDRDMSEIFMRAHAWLVKNKVYSKIRLFYLLLDEEDPDIREIKPEWFLKLTKSIGIDHRTSHIRALIKRIRVIAIEGFAKALERFGFVLEKRPPVLVIE